MPCSLTLCPALAFCSQYAPDGLPWDAMASSGEDPQECTLAHTLYWACFILNPGEGGKEHGWGRGVFCQPCLTESGMRSREAESPAWGIQLVSEKDENWAGNFSASLFPGPWRTAGCRLRLQTPSPSLSLSICILQLFSSPLVTPPAEAIISSQSFKSALPPPGELI